MIEIEHVQQLAGAIANAAPHARRLLRAASQLDLVALQQLPHWLAAGRAAQRVRELHAEIRRLDAEPLNIPTIEQLPLAAGEPCSPSCALRRCRDCDMS